MKQSQLKKKYKIIFCAKNDRVWKFFKITGIRDIFSFRDFTVPKFALHNKIVSKAQTIRNQEKSTQVFQRQVFSIGDKYLTNHFVEFLRDWVKP